MSEYKRKGKGKKKTRPFKAFNHAKGGERHASALQVTTLSKCEYGIARGGGEG